MSTMRLKNYREAKELQTRKMTKDTCLMSSMTFKTTVDVNDYRQAETGSDDKET